MIDPLKDDCPSGWARTTLGEPLQWGSGGTPLSSRTDYYGGDIPWAIIGDLNDGHVSETASFITEDGLQHSSAKWVEPDSVLLAMYGSIGKLGINAIPLTTNQAIAYTNPEPISSKYLFYYLMSARAGLISRGKGGTQSNISQTVIKGFPFLVAPLPEQHRIVEAIESFLTRLDDAMATLERLHRNLKRYRASVLKAAVEGRLVPTEAELARAQGREYETASMLLERILAERRRRWEEAELAKMKVKGAVPKNDKWKAKYVEPARPDTSELSELPEGWCWASMDQLTARITSGSRDWTQYYDRGDSIFLMAQNVRPGFLDLTHKQFVDPPLEDTSCERSQVRANDLLVTIVGANTGDVCRVPVELSRHYVCQSVALMRPVEPSSSHYIHFYLNSAAGQAAYANFMYGQGRPHLSFDNLRETVIPLPPLGEQLRIHEVIEQKLSVAEEISGSIFVELLRCTRLRQSILKWAFEGRLVDQDPNDEPAAVLLERIRAERAAGNGKRQSRPRRVNTRSASA